MFHWLIGSKCRLKRQQQQFSTTQLSTQLVSPPPLSEFEDKLFHWLIGVKCQNLRYLNLSLYFNLLCHFQIHHALYHLPVVIASPLHSHHSVQLLFHTHHFHSNFPVPFLLFPTPLVYSYTTLISTPFIFPLLHFANAVVKLLFPSMFFTLCPLTTQIKSLPPSHKL